MPFLPLYCVKVLSPLPRLSPLSHPRHSLNHHHNSLGSFGLPTFAFSLLVSFNTFNIVVGFNPSAIKIYVIFPSLFFLFFFSFSLSFCCCPDRCYMCVFYDLSSPIHKAPRWKLSEQHALDARSSLRIIIDNSSIQDAECFHIKRPFTLLPFFSFVGHIFATSILCVS